MSSTEQIWILMARKLSGEATEVELTELNDLLRQHPHINYSKEILQDLWQSRPTHDRQYAENKYKELVQQLKNMGLDQGQFVQDDHYIINEAPKNAGNKKYLFSIFYCLAAFALIAGGLFYYSANQVPKKDFPAHSTNEISTKKGSKTNLVLPDGTKVWLNASSQLTYDKNYGNTLREVTLTGEAYFDVVKNKEKPFLIHTTKMDIKVLGTAFNVKCYPGDKTTETSLVRGSIEITLKDRQEKIMMKPNEKLVLNNDETTAIKNTVTVNKDALQKTTALRTNTEKPIISLGHLTVFPADNTVIETAWVQNRLVFSSETFEEIALKMERWYNVKIAFMDELIKTEHLTGNFEKETITEALNALQLTTKFFYSIKNDNIIINKQK
jgi:transmembrane sensor